MPPSGEGFAGLVLLGAGPNGVVSGNLIPSLGPELRLTRDFLDRGLPVVGIGVGCCILTTAAGGGADDAPLRFTVERAGARSRRAERLFAGDFPHRRLYAGPAGAAGRRRVLAVGASGEPVVFQMRGNCLGFLGHPGAKSAMIEDLIMEFEEVPEGTAETLGELRAAQAEIAAVLGDIMVGLIELTHLMQPPGNRSPPDKGKIFSSSL